MSTFVPRGNTRALVLATLAFTVSFYAWSMMGPLGPDLQDLLDLSEIQLAMMIAVPVLMGSLMRIPLGLLTDRYGGRRVFTALLAFTLAAAGGARALARLLRRGDPLRVLPRLRRGLVRRGRAVRQPLVPP